MMDIDIALTISRFVYDVSDICTVLQASRLLCPWLPTRSSFPLTSVWCVNSQYDVMDPDSLLAVGMPHPLRRVLDATEIYHAYAREPCSRASQHDMFSPEFSLFWSGFSSYVFSDDFHMHVVLFMRDSDYILFYEEILSSRLTRYLQQHHTVADGRILRFISVRPDRISIYSHARQPNHLQRKTE